jgi:hypothetical protein
VVIGVTSDVTGCPEPANIPSLSGRGGAVPDLRTDIAELDMMIEKVRQIRTRTCEPKSNSNPRYLALSNVVSNLQKAADDMRTEL